MAMTVRQNRWTPREGWHSRDDTEAKPQLVLTFAPTDLLAQPETLALLPNRYPEAIIAYCSTAGEILGENVFDGSLTTTAVHFEHTRIKGAQVPVVDASESRRAGLTLAAELRDNDLTYVLVLSDGLHVNGSDLAAGLEEGLPKGVIVTGGLSGDGSRFTRTLIGLDDAPQEKIILAIGFYGDRLRVEHGSMGGWDPFGPDRLVTRSRGNILYELDGRSALDLYKQYLGDYAAELPASGLLFPLLVHPNNEEKGLVRTILGVDEEGQSLTFAGDIPEGSYARLMKANFDRLIEGAVEAAKGCTLPPANQEPSLALLISCVGRKLLLKQRVEEEVEGVLEILGGTVPCTGFYSYGELSPLVATDACELHNQTMTITTFVEV